MKARFTKKMDPGTIMLLKQIGFGMLFVGFVILLFISVWHLARMESLTIQSVTVTGGETISHELVEKQVTAQLDGEYLGFIPRRFAWLYPQADVVAAVEGVPRTHSVDVERVGGTELAVSFAEYVPFALWCEAYDSEECVFIDETGYAFAKAPSLHGGALLRFSHVTAEPVVGTTTLAVAAVATATELVERLAEVGWNIYHIELDPVGDSFLYVVDGGELKVALADEPALVVENLQVVLNSPEFQHIEPGNFQYIDLRFGNKVFVNEKPAIPEREVASSTASTTAAAE